VGGGIPCRPKLAATGHTTCFFVVQTAIMFLEIFSPLTESVSIIIIIFITSAKKVMRSMVFVHLWFCHSFCEQVYCESNQPSSLKLGISMTLNNPWPSFQGHAIHWRWISYKRLKNGHSYCGRRIENCTQSFEWYHGWHYDRTYQSEELISFCCWWILDYFSSFLIIAEYVV